MDKDPTALIFFSSVIVKSFQMKYELRQKYISVYKYIYRYIFKGNKEDGGFLLSFAY